MSCADNWERRRAKPLVPWLVLLIAPGLCEAEDIPVRRIALTCDERFFDVRAIAFSPDGSFLASGNPSHEVKLWESATGRELAVLHQRSEVGCVDRVFDVRFSGDGTRLLSAHLDRVVRVWDPVGRRLLTNSKLLLSDDLAITSMIFSPNAKSLAVVGFTRRAGDENDDPRTWEIFVCDLPLP